MEILTWIVVVAIGVLIAVVLVVLIAFLALRGKLRRIGRALESAGGDLPRYRVRLEPLPVFQWHHQEASERAVGRLAAARFAEAGRFTLDENPAARIVGLANEDDSLFAVVYELGASGPHVDVVGEYDDGRHLTVTNVAETGLDEPDRRITLRAPDADASALVATARDQRPDGTLVPVRVDDFQPVFERAYADEMDWRVARGGYTRSEIAHAAHIQAAALGDDDAEVEDVTIDMMRATFDSVLFSGVDDALRERLEETTSLPVGEWEEVRDHLVFVYDELPDRLLLDRLETCATDHPTADHRGTLEETIAGRPAREAFAAVVAGPGDPAVGGVRLLATVDRPYAADVYVAPAGSAGA